MLMPTTKRWRGAAVQPSVRLPAMLAAAAIMARPKWRRLIDRSRAMDMDVSVLMALEKIEDRRVALFRHFAEVAVPSAFDENQFGAGNFFRQHFGGVHVAAGAAFVHVLAANDHQGRRLDFMNQLGGFVALARDHVAQITF